MNTQLLEKSLQLTWKDLSYIRCIVDQWTIMQPNWEFISTKYDISIEKFFYYIISKEFQEAVLKVAYSFPDDTKFNFIHWFLHKITIWMVEYQEWDEERLTSLLETICNTQNQK